MDEEEVGASPMPRSGGSRGRTEEARPVTAMPAGSEGDELELATARLRAAEARLLQAVANRDRALARVARLTAPVKAPTT
jgi:hypothetical protein